MREDNDRIAENLAVIGRSLLVVADFAWKMANAFSWIRSHLERGLTADLEARIPACRVRWLGRDNSGLTLPAGVREVRFEDTEGKTWHMIWMEDRNVGQVVGRMNRYTVDINSGDLVAID